MNRPEPKEKRVANRRECDNCVKDSVNEMLGSFTYQKWLVRILVASILAGSGFNVWSAYAMSEKNGEQDSRLTSLEQNQKHVLEHMTNQTLKLERLITLAEERNSRLAVLESRK